VEISGRFELPATYAGHPPVVTIVGEDYLTMFPEVIGQQFRLPDVAPGVYVIHVTGVAPDDRIAAVPSAEVYFAHLNVDARHGSATGLVVPAMDAPKYRTNPPIASLITVSPADENGDCEVSGGAGALEPLGRVSVFNLQTNQLARSLSEADGSFSVRMFAPAGSWLAVRHEPVHFGDSFAGVGTTVRVPLPDLQGTNFTVSFPASPGEDRPASGSPARDFGQWVVRGTVSTRQWQPGGAFAVAGTLDLHSRNLGGVAVETLYAPLELYLERVFDAKGRQDVGNPLFLSPRTTPTGLPLERYWGGLIRLDVPGQIVPGAFTAVSSSVARAAWSGTLTVPSTLPAGIYRLIVRPSTLYWELPSDPHPDAYPTGSNGEGYLGNIYPTGGAVLTRVGSPSAPRLTTVLLANHASGGSRGAIAREDRGHFQMAGHVAANTDVFVVPRLEPRTGQPLRYRLEPFVPMIATSNREIPGVPTVPLAFPSGSLEVAVTNPDGSTRIIGPAPFRQYRYSSPVTRGGFAYKGTSNGPADIYELTTLDPAFEVTFEHDGVYVVTLNGHVEDVYGASYEISGTYDLHVARPLKVDAGVVPGTPFEVGDAFAPTVVLDPPVAGRVRLRLLHLPFSDPTRAHEQIVVGVANRYGWFQPDPEPALTFSAPGEYRVDITAAYRDEDGVVWAGSATWGSVVETPATPVVTHGRRGFEDGSLTQPQWLEVLQVGDRVGNHLQYPFSSGDVMWMQDTHVDFASNVPKITVQDPEGTLATIVRARSKNDPAHVSGAYDIEEAIATGQIPLFSTAADGGSPFLDPGAPGHHFGYFYASAARPGVRVRDLVTEDQPLGYWRFDDPYYRQVGVGGLGDEPNDIKFQFGGAVYRAEDLDYYLYGAYASLWVLLPDDDQVGGRIFPPFQGAGGGPSGGPIMTLKGEEIDIFFHPTALRPGAMLHLGQPVLLAGQVGPPLPSRVEITVTSPGGVQRRFEGRANKVGYYFDPTSTFTADEEGVWNVVVRVKHDGLTSAGPVQPPYPEGGVLGSDTGRFRFYVVSPAAPSPAVTVATPGAPQRTTAVGTFLAPPLGPVEFTVAPPEPLSDVALSYTTTMPGFLLEEGHNASLTYAYEAERLAQGFPNLDLQDVEGITGSDVVTVSLLVSGRDAEGTQRYFGRVLAVRGEELVVPEQQPTLPRARRRLSP